MCNNINIIIINDNINVCVILLNNIINNNESNENEILMKVIIIY